MKFRLGNRIGYGQDFSQYRGIPAGVDFVVRKIERDTGRYTLTAYGYGEQRSICCPTCKQELENPPPYDTKQYGNGCLYVSTCSVTVTPAMKKRIKEAAI